MNKIKLKTASSKAAAVLWMMLIFYLSSQTAGESLQTSNSFSGRIYAAIVKIFPGFGILELPKFDEYVRIFAHFAVYLVLGVLVYNAVMLHIKYYINAEPQVINVNEKGGNRHKTKMFLISFVICTVYALTDEIHQIFVPGRGAELSDIATDAAGSVAGILIFLLLASIISRRRANLASAKSSSSD